MPFGVSNSYKRSIMKTYAGRHGRSFASSLPAARLHSEQQQRVRIRMDEQGFVCEEHVAATAADASGSTQQRRNARQVSPPPPSSPGASSLQSHKLFSDGEQLTSESPPSSPPLHRPSSPSHPHKHTFKSLKRKRAQLAADYDHDDGEDSQVLGQVSDNANARRPPPNHKRSRPSAAKRTRLTQMQLDLGRSARRTCRECGMQYVPGNREDERLHREFHSLNEAGVDLGTNFARDAQTIEKFGFGEVVALVDARSPANLRKRVLRVLDVVQTDLGAVGISEERLWGGSASKGGANKKPPDAHERAKLFVYLAGDKCVGLCLAERIRHASKVVDSRAQPAAAAEAAAKQQQSSATASATTVQATPTPPATSAATESSSNKRRRSAAGGSTEPSAELPNLPDSTPSALHTETSVSPILLGISRIWVSRSHRRKGIATTLLDAARHNFFYGIEVPAPMVAFSQPTESGRLLAEMWFGQRVGWHVYAES